MKLSSILVATLASFSLVVDATNLRASNDASLERKKKKRGGGQDSWGYMGATVTVTHVNGDKTNLDDDKVSQALKNSYNSVHSNGYTLETVFVDKEIVIPESLVPEVKDDMLGRRNRSQHFTPPTPRYVPPRPPQNGSSSSSGGRSGYSSSLYYFYTSFNCRLCSPDDNAALLTGGPPGPSNDKNEREAFELDFMARLRESDMPAFADITDLHVDFTYTDPTADEAATVVIVTDVAAEAALMAQVAKRNRKQPTEEFVHGQMEIAHVKIEEGSSMAKDISALGQNYMDAYNEVYASQGLELTSFSLEREVDVPESTGVDSEDSEDADSEEEDGPDGMLGRRSSRRYRAPPRRYVGSLYYYSVSFNCRLCHPDDDSMLGSGASMIQESQDTGAHLFFEKLFCHKMKKSGFAEYDEVNHCAIAFEAANALASQ